MILKRVHMLHYCIMDQSSQWLVVKVRKINGKEMGKHI